MCVGLTQTIEGLKNKDESFWEKKGIFPKTARFQIQNYDINSYLNLQPARRLYQFETRQLLYEPILLNWSSSLSPSITLSLSLFNVMPNSLSNAEIYRETDEEIDKDTDIYIAPISSVSVEKPDE